jgi:predicted ester cyclase
MSAESKALVRAFFELQDREVRTPTEMFTPDFIAHLHGSPPMDSAAYNEYEGAFFASFSSIEHVLDNVLAEDDRVAFLMTLQATHTGDFMGISTTGRRISVPAIGIMRIADGQIAELWGAPDVASLMQQLNVAPEQEQRPDAN